MRWVALILVGIAWWTLLEYLLHRFAFHTRNPVFGRRHIAHHARLDERRLAIAPWFSMLGGALVQALILFTVFGPAQGGAILTGLLLGYAAYEWTHYGTHYRVARTRYGRYLRAWHLAHHHKSPRARFGVTSPFWDVVFGTYEPVQTGKRR
jgi:sterol desaturase/sphingolipid hydroxylase (fatty acid hydroxylase superfamily)